MDPPHQPQGADKEFNLGECLNWPLLWPKALIRLDPQVDASVTSPAKATPPVLESSVEPTAAPHGKGPAVDDLGLDDCDDGGFMDNLDDPLPDLDLQTNVPDLPEKAQGSKRHLFGSQEKPEVEPLFTEDQRPDVLITNTLHNVAG